MKAGKTRIDVGMRVRVTAFASNDPDDRALIGIEGEITHPFPGAMVGSAKEPAYLNLIRAALKKRGFMSPSGAALYRVDFDQMVREAIEAAA